MNPGRRVRKLYPNPCCDYFLSRQALGLTYTSCREDESHGALRCAQKIAVRLGGAGAQDQLEWLPKPKGMHWSTYRRLRSTAPEASVQSWSGVLRRSGRLGTHRLDDLLAEW